LLRRTQQRFFSSFGGLLFRGGRSVFAAACFDRLLNNALDQAPILRVVLRGWATKNAPALFAWRASALGITSGRSSPPISALLLHDPLGGSWAAFHAASRCVFGRLASANSMQFFGSFGGLLFCGGQSVFGAACFDQLGTPISANPTEVPAACNALPFALVQRGLLGANSTPVFGA